MSAELSSLYRDVSPRARTLHDVAVTKALRRLFLALWLLAALLSIGVTAFALSGIRYAPGFEVRGAIPREVMPAAEELSEARIQAYYGGTLSRSEMRRFEVDVRDGFVVVPKRHNIVVGGLIEGWERPAIIIAFSAVGLYASLALLQFLVLGFGGPIRLLRKTQASTAKQASVRQLPAAAMTSHR